MQFPLRRMVFETKDHEASGNSQTGCNSIDRIVPLDLLKKKKKTHNSYTSLGKSNIYNGPPLDIAK